MGKISSVNVVKHTICSSFENPFFIHHRYILQNVYENGKISKEYVNEFFDRKGIDCVAVIPYKIMNSKIYVGILSAFRPSVYFRKNYNLYCKENIYTKIFECVAGSLENSDIGEDGLVFRAKEELMEEAGFDVLKTQIYKLGGSFFPSHGQSTEKIHLFKVDVTNVPRSVPIGDGSVNEELNQLVFFEINDLRKMCFDGDVEDPKIEIGVNRLFHEL